MFLKSDEKALYETSRVDKFLAAKGAGVESGRHSPSMLPQAAIPRGALRAT